MSKRALLMRQLARTAAHTAAVRHARAAATARHIAHQRAIAHEHATHAARAAARRLAAQRKAAHRRALIAARTAAHHHHQQAIQIHKQIATFQMTIKAVVWHDTEDRIDCDKLRKHYTTLAKGGLLKWHSGEENKLPVDVASCASTRDGLTVIKKMATTLARKAASTLPTSQHGRKRRLRQMHVLYRTLFHTPTSTRRHTQANELKLNIIKGMIQTAIVRLSTSKHSRRLARLLSTLKQRTAIRIQQRSHQSELEADSHCCYLFFNIYTTKTYIGRTCSFRRRLSEHTREIKKARKARGSQWRKTSYKYKVMSKVQTDHWCMWPIVECDEYSVKYIEGKLIQQWQPKLNTNKWKRLHYHRKRVIRRTRKKTSTLKHIDAKTSQHITFQKNATVYLPVWQVNPTFKTGKSLSLSGLLNNHIRTAPKNTDLVVTRVPATKDYTNTTILRRSFGRSRAILFPTNKAIPPTRGLLKDLIAAIKNHSGVIRISPRKNAMHTHQVKRDLTKLATAPARTTLLRKMHPRDLMWTYFKANKLPKQLRSTLRTRITNILKKYYSLPPLNRLTIKVPVNFYSKSKLYQLAQAMVDDSAHPEFIKKFIMRKTKIVFTRRRTIKDYLFNIIKQSKESTTTKPKCTCRNIKQFLGSNKTVNTSNKHKRHCVLTAHDLPDHLSFLKQNINNTPIPERIDTYTELHRAFHKYGKDIDKFHVTDKITGDRDPHAQPKQWRLIWSKRQKTYFGFVNNSCVGNISQRKYNSLRQRFFHTKRRHKHIHEQLQAKPFQDEVVHLLQRHKRSRTHKTTTTAIQGVLHKHFACAYSMLDSPLTAHPNMTHFSHHARDKLFGAHHNAFHFKWQGVVTAAPQHKPHHINKAVRYALAATQNREPAATFLITPQFISTTDLRMLYAHHTCHVLAQPVHGNRRTCQIILICNDAFLHKQQITRYTLHRLRHACEQTWKCQYTVRQPTKRRPTESTLRPQAGYRHMPTRKHGPPAPPTQDQNSTTIDMDQILQRLHRPTPDEIARRPHMNIPTLHQHQCVTPPIATLRHIKRTLGDSAVGYLDKNNGLLFIACKRWYWYRNKAMFLDDHEHYEFISEDQSDILMESFQEFHSKHGLGKLHRFDTTKSIPYSYILVKAKDINRSRPIVSYYLHPLKKTFNIASRGLGFMLRQSKMRSFTLWACKDMTATLKRFQQDLKNTYGPHTRYMAYCADIKNMYTSLPHDAIIDAIRFAIQYCMDHTRGGRRKALTFELKKRGRIAFGKSTTSYTHASLTFKQIYEICKYDITHAYFTTLGQTVRQILGIPMGSPGSPAYAICICMFYEHKFHTSLHHFSTILRCPTDTMVRAIRYIDDVLAFITWDERNSASKVYAHAITSLIATAYHKNMKLKEEAPTHELPFLQGKVIIKNNTIHVKYNNKNLPSILTTGNQKLYTVKHRHTFMTEASARNTVIGALHRLRNTSATKAQTIADASDMYICFSALGYTAKTFCDALKAVAHKTTEKRWSKIAKLITAAAHNFANTRYKF